VIARVQPPRPDVPLELTRVELAEMLPPPSQLDREAARTGGGGKQHRRGSTNTAEFEPKDTSSTPEQAASCDRSSGVYALTLPLDPRELRTAAHRRVWHAFL
jgi:hypothetical protein